MFKNVIMISVLLLLAISPVIAAETVYSSVVDDLPLMQGMTERPDDTVVFDKPAGRIVEFSTDTSATADAVKNFYQQVLPPLGWKPSQSATFVRDDETLKIDFDKTDSETLVHFTLTPNTQGK